MNILVAILITLALIWLSNHDFHKVTKRKANKRAKAIKRIQLRNPLNGRYAKKLPLAIIHVRPRFRYVEERLMVRV